MPERLAVFVSGSGTTMAEIIKATHKDPRVKGRVEVGMVLASKDGIGAIDRAMGLGILPKDIVIIKRGDHRDSEGNFDEDSYADHILSEMDRRHITAFSQNGWLVKTPRAVIAEYPLRSFNQHPADPRFFGGIFGRQVIAAVLRFSDLVGRPIVNRPVAQRVSEEYDGGEIVAYRSVDVPRKPGYPKNASDEEFERIFKERVEAFQKLNLSVEHLVQIDLLHQLAHGRVEQSGMPKIVRSDEDRELLERAKHQAVQLFPKG